MQKGDEREISEEISEGMKWGEISEERDDMRRLQVRD